MTFWNYIIWSLMITYCGLCASSFTYRLGRYTSRKGLFHAYWYLQCTSWPIQSTIWRFNGGFSGILNVSTRRLFFNISFLRQAPRVSMEYNVLILSLGNLMILLTKEKDLLLSFHAKEPAICTNLSRSIADDILRHAAPYPLNINVYALCIYGYRLM